MKRLCVAFLTRDLGLGEGISNGHLEKAKDTEQVFFFIRLGSGQVAVGAVAVPVGIRSGRGLQRC